MTTASASTRTSPSGSWGEQGTGTVPPAAGLCGVSSPAVGGTPDRCSPTGDVPYGASRCLVLLPGTYSCPLRCKSGYRRDLACSPTAQHHPSARVQGAAGRKRKVGGRKSNPSLPSPRASLSFLSTFIHNMLAFGLNKKLCSDFLKKQATIGNLDEGRGQPGGCALPSWGPGGMEPTCLAGMLPHPPTTLFSLLRRAIQAAQRPHRADGHRIATWPARCGGDGGRSGWERERNPPPGLPETEAGLLKKKKPHTHTHKLQ